MRLALVLLVFALACARQPGIDLDRERAAVLATDSAWLAAANSGDLNATVAFWTEDARVIAPGQPPLIGQDAIREMVADGFATPGFSVSWKTTDVVMGPSGDVAYSFGTNAFIVPGPRRGVLDTLRGQSVVVWRKTEAGWRAAVDTWTPQPR